MLNVRVVGPGRAGRSLAAALTRRGAAVVGLLGRADDVRDAARGVDVLVLATPDDAVGAVAAAVTPDAGAAVVHLSGSLGLDVLAPHPRRASLHPLVPLPDPDTGCQRLLAGPSFAVDGDPAAEALARLLGGRPRRVAPDDRAAYHAAACMAANHLVGLLGQVDRVATGIGLSVADFVDLARAALDDVARLGPAAALTGPAARGDEATLARHRAALAPGERAAYDAGVALVRRLVAERPAVPGGAPMPAAAAGAPARAVVPEAEAVVGATAGAGRTGEARACA